MSALDRLNERLANGEISEDEYEKTKALIDEDRKSPDANSTNEVGVGMILAGVAVGFFWTWALKQAFPSGDYELNGFGFLMYGIAFIMVFGGVIKIVLGK